MMQCWHQLLSFLVTTMQNSVCYARLWVCRSSANSHSSDFRSTALLQWSRKFGLRKMTLWNKNSKITREFVYVVIGEMIPQATVPGIVYPSWTLYQCCGGLFSHRQEGDWWQFHHNGERGPPETAGKAGSFFPLWWIDNRCFTNSD